MGHPNFLDKLRLKYNPHYLYPQQNGQVIATVVAGIVHKTPSASKPFWKIMDYVKLQKGSLIKFIGYVKKLKFEGDVQPYDSIFELINPIMDVNDPHHFSAGDTICVNPSDRQFIFPVPQDPPQLSPTTLTPNSAPPTSDAPASVQELSQPAQSTNNS